MLDNAIYVIYTKDAKLPKFDNKQNNSINNNNHLDVGLDYFVFHILIMLHATGLFSESVNRLLISEVIN